MSSKITIIIPVYNHAEAIEITVEKVREELAELHVILVNDGSDQVCSEVLEKIQQEVAYVHLLNLPKNLGKENHPQPARHARKRE